MTIHDIHLSVVGRLLRIVVFFESIHLQQCRIDFEQLWTTEVSDLGSTMYNLQVPYRDFRSHGIEQVVI